MSEFEHPSLLAALGNLTSDQRLLLALVVTEWTRAAARWPAFNSSHEGYAVILEELDELWAEVKNDKQSHEYHVSRMTAESIQAAAMALRFADEIGDHRTLPPPGILFASA